MPDALLLLFILEGKKKDRLAAVSATSDQMF